MEIIITPQKPHAVVLASPGQGHLTPFIELVNNLVSHHNFEVTFFVVISNSSSTIQSQTLSSTSNNKFLHVHVLQPDDYDDDESLEHESDFIKRIVVTMQMCIPHVRSFIYNMKMLPDLLIVDMFGLDYWNLADEFGMCKYVFLTTSAWFLALTVYLPIVDEDVADEGVDFEYISIPGCEPVLKRDEMLPVTPDNPRYLGYINVGKRIGMSDGIIVNSWQELEPKTIKSFDDPNQLGKVINGRVYAIGPLVKKVAPSENNKVLKWMDNQPDESVIYVSFGSGGSLTYDQIQELAFGLELSQQRFIWVIRPPSNKDNVSSFFFTIDIGDESHDALINYLPKGFMTRTKDVGLIVPMWAPQAEILQHKAIGGFITHCGWNSIIESVVNGVPMVAWPLFAEQGLNATMITKELNIAVKPEVVSSDDGDNLISRDEIEKAIRKIMVDKSCYGFRERVMKLKNEAIEAGENDNGSSYKSLSEFSKMCSTMKMK